MDKILSLQGLSLDGTDAEGGSWLSWWCNNNSGTSNCCEGTCPAEPEPEIDPS